MADGGFHSSCLVTWEVIDELLSQVSYSIKQLNGVHFETGNSSEILSHLLSRGYDENYYIFFQLKKRLDLLIGSLCAKGR